MVATSTLDNLGLLMEVVRLRSSAVPFTLYFKTCLQESINAERDAGLPIA